MRPLLRMLLGEKKSETIIQKNGGPLTCAPAGKADLATRKVITAYFVVP